jgi:hypothetical protein
MMESIAFYGATKIGDYVGCSAREIPDADQQIVGIQTQILGELAPLARTNVAHAILAADLHRRFKESHKIAQPRTRILFDCALPIDYWRNGDVELRPQLGRALFCSD